MDEEYQEEKINQEEEEEVVEELISVEDKPNFDFVQEDAQTHVRETLSTETKNDVQEQLERVTVEDTTPPITPESDTAAIQDILQEDVPVDIPITDNNQSTTPPTSIKEDTPTDLIKEATPTEFSSVSSISNTTSSSPTGKENFSDAKPKKKKSLNRSPATSSKTGTAKTPPTKTLPAKVPSKSPKNSASPQTGRRQSGNKFQPTVPKPFNFSLGQRLEDRSKYNEKMKLAREMQEERERIEKERSQIEEEQQVKELRKMLVPKARPIQYYDPIVVTPSNKPLTVPQAPNLILGNRNRDTGDQRGTEDSASRIKQVL